MWEILMSYLTPTLRLDNAHARATSTWQQVTIPAVDALFELVTGRASTTELPFPPYHAVPGPIRQEMHHTHRAIHTPMAQSCCDAADISSDLRRQFDTGPLALLAVDAIAATDPGPLLQTAGTHPELYPTEEDFEHRLGLRHQAANRVATLRALQWSAISVATTGFTTTPLLEQLHEAFTVLTDPTHGPARVDAALALTRATSTGEPHTYTDDQHELGLTARLTTVCAIAA